MSDSSERDAEVMRRHARRVEEVRQGEVAKPLAETLDGMGKHYPCTKTCTNCGRDYDGFTFEPTLEGKHAGKVGICGDPCTGKEEARAEAERVEREAAQLELKPPKRVHSDEDEEYEDRHPGASHE